MNKKIVGITVGTTMNPKKLIKTDETMSYENGVLSVNTAEDLENDNTLPVAASTFASTVGNIEILLKTI